MIKRKLVVLGAIVGLLLAGSGAAMPTLHAYAITCSPTNQTSPCFQTTGLAGTTTCYVNTTCSWAQQWANEDHYGAIFYIYFHNNNTGDSFIYSDGVFGGCCVGLSGVHDYSHGFATAGISWTTYFKDDYGRTGGSFFFSTQ